LAPVSALQPWLTSPIPSAAVLLQTEPEDRALIRHNLDIGSIYSNSRLIHLELGWFRLELTEETMKARIATISEAPLIGLFGSKAAYRVLMYLENYGKGYAAQIARTFGMSLSQVQNQLRKFEDLALLTSRREGSARVYYFNRNPVADSLRAFLRSTLERLPDDTVRKFYRERRRPRRPGKR